MAPIMYDPTQDQFVVVSEVHCDRLVIDTGCYAPGCSGFACEICDEGCDRVSNPNGVCVSAEIAETDEQFTARITAERAAWGLRSADPGSFPSPAPADLGTRHG